MALGQHRHLGNHLVRRCPSAGREFVKGVLPCDAVKLHEKLRAEALHTGVLGTLQPHPYDLGTGKRSSIVTAVVQNLRIDGQRVIDRRGFAHPGVPHQAEPAGVCVVAGQMAEIGITALDTFLQLAHFSIPTADQRIPGDIPLPDRRVDFACDLSGLPQRDKDMGQRLDARFPLVVVQRALVFIIGDFTAQSLKQFLVRQAVRQCLDPRVFPIERPGGGGVQGVSPLCSQRIFFHQVSSSSSKKRANKAP